MFMVMAMVIGVGYGSAVLWVPVTELTFNDELQHFTRRLIVCDIHAETESFEHLSETLDIIIGSSSSAKRVMREINIVYNN